MEITETFADQATEIDPGDRDQRLDPVVGDGRMHGVGAAAADAADTCRLDIGQRHQLIDGVTDVGYADRRVLHEAWFTAVGALEAGIEGNHHEAFPGQARTVDIARG